MFGHYTLIQIVLRFGLSFGVWGIVSIWIIRLLDLKVFTLLTLILLRIIYMSLKLFMVFFIQRTGEDRRK